ncbi:AAA family ATPase [Corallococcus exiguus]|uniref:AAA family ATPase n=1 Tax=Corallococcus exiguus TaxID=83462 RepID=UPI0015609BEC|nr:AAA family ATPase [Corallococcus exiguus]NRD49832.1 AAA family ATPase [Corallococcus exiguus]
MAVTVVVVSGPIGAGKTTLAQGLARRFGALHLRSDDFLREHFPEGSYGWRRSRLHQGIAKDSETGGRWLADSVLAALHGHGFDAMTPSRRVPGLAVVDAANSAEQLDGLRGNSSIHVVHVHLEVSEPERASRGEEQPSLTSAQNSGPDTFAKAQPQVAEGNVHALASVADLVVDRTTATSDAVLVRVASRLELYGRQGERLVDLIIPSPHGEVNTRPLTAQLAPHYSFLLRPGAALSREELEDAFARGHRVLVESTGPSASGCIQAAGIAPGRVRRVVLACRSEGRAFDWVGLREAASLNAPTDLALTLAEDLAATNWASRRFDQLTDAARHHLEELERVAGAPVSFLAPSPEARHLIERRPW